MGYQPHYISSFEEESGLSTYYEPFLISEKAFVTLQDAYCWRGRVIRRRGFTLLGRLRRILKVASIGNISSIGAGAFIFNIWTGLGIAATEPNAQLQPGTAADPIIIDIAAPISQVLWDTGSGVLTVIGAGVITSGTINYNTGDMTLIFSGASAASAATINTGYYPSLPVMGLRTQERPAINAEDMIAFDQKYAYKFNATTHLFEELPAAVATIWHGGDDEFFWSTNYYKNATGPLFWATNTHMTGTRDPLRYYDTNAWTAFAPLVTAVDTIYNAEVVIPYKDRLLFFNTWEGTTVAGIAAATNFPQRVRWSQNGSPLDANAFRTDIVGLGGYLDAPTSEVIISVEFVKDTLLVKFERSSWKIVYTGNEVLPFVFQKINTELGSESKFSLVPFDRGVFSVGNYGITVDDSVNVQRIDMQIPNTIFSFNNDKSGTVRVHGIRDYYNELVYWTFPNSAQNPTFPNRVLTYNYRNETYALFTDSFTCFGYYQRSSDLTWVQLPYLSWAQWNTSWESGITQSFFPDVVAGNQHGFVEIVAQKTLNDASLYIYTSDFTLDPPTFNIPNHNLETNDIISISGIVGAGVLPPDSLNDQIFRVNKIDNSTVSLNVFVAPDTFVDLFSSGLVGLASEYLGNGVVTKYNNFIIKTKRFSPFYEQGSQCRLGYVDYFLFKTDSGEATGTISIDENDTFSMTDSSVNTALMGSDVVFTKPDNLALIPFQANMQKIWHRQFVQSIAQNFQITLSMSQVQNATLDIVSCDFQMHAMAFYLSPNSRMTQ
jgi:hypothetical protein